MDVDDWRKLLPLCASVFSNLAGATELLHDQLLRQDSRQLCHPCLLVNVRRLLNLGNDANSLPLGATSYLKTLGPHRRCGESGDDGNLVLKKDDGDVKIVYEQFNPHRANVSHQPQSHQNYRDCCSRHLSHRAPANETNRASSSTHAEMSNFNSCSTPGFGGPDFSMLDNLGGGNPSSTRSTTFRSFQPNIGDPAGDSASYLSPGNAACCQPPPPRPPPWLASSASPSQGPPGARPPPCTTPGPRTGTNAVSHNANYPHPHNNPPTNDAIKRDFANARPNLQDFSCDTRQYNGFPSSPSLPGAMNGLERTQPGTIRRDAFTGQIASPSLVQPCPRTPSGVSAQSFDPTFPSWTSPISASHHRRFGEGTSGAVEMAKPSNANRPSSMITSHSSRTTKTVTFSDGTRPRENSRPGSVSCPPKKRVLNEPRPGTAGLPLHRSAPISNLAWSESEGSKHIPTNLSTSSLRGNLTVISTQALVNNHLANQPSSAGDGKDADSSVKSDSSIKSDTSDPGYLENIGEKLEDPRSETTQGKASSDDRPATSIGSGPSSAFDAIQFVGEFAEVVGRMDNFAAGQILDQDDLADDSELRDGQNGDQGTKEAPSGGFSATDALPLSDENSDDEDDDEDDEEDTCDYDAISNAVSDATSDAVANAVAQDPHCFEQGAKRRKIDSAVNCRNNDSAEELSQPARVRRSNSFTF